MMYGIDFGTSNTVVSVNLTDGKTKLLPIGKDSFVLPTLLFLSSGGEVSVGENAIADYTEALYQYRDEEDLFGYFRFFQAIKLAIKDSSFIGVKAFDRLWTVEELVGLILFEVKKRSDGIVGEDVKSVVIGRPVVLDNDPKKDKELENRLREAAILAGFTEVHFVFEPVAAIMSSEEGKRNEKVLVFDFGGGTLDISIADFHGEQPRILASVGETLGGYTLSERISKARILEHFGSGGEYTTVDGRSLKIPFYLTEQVSSFYALPLSNIAATRKVLRGYFREANEPNKLFALDEFLSKNLSYNLFAKIDEAKIALSGSESSDISFDIPPHIAINETILRSEFEFWISEYVDIARVLIFKALYEADTKPGEINRVVCVGGSSQIPSFKSMLTDIFPGRVSSGDIFTSISAGLIKAHEEGLSCRD